MQGHVQGRQYQSDSAEQFDQDVERWACRVLKRVTNGVTDDTGLVGFALLAQNGAGWIEAINHLAFSIHAQVSSFDILFRVVPRAATIVEEEGQDDTTHGTNHQHTGLSMRAQDGTNRDGSEDGDQAGQNHGTKRTTCADVYATGVIGIVAFRRVFRDDLGVGANLAAYFFNHTLGGSSYSANGQRAEEEDQRDAD